MQLYNYIWYAIKPFKNILHYVFWSVYIWKTYKDYVYLCVDHNYKFNRKLLNVKGQNSGLEAIF